VNSNRRGSIVSGLMLVPVMIYARAPQVDLDTIQQALDIPTSIAKVSDGQTLSTTKIPEIILVQDVHRHPEVQGHIAALILQGSRHWGLKSIYLEGASANTLVARPVEHDMTSLRDALNDGRLSGAEMAMALEPDSPLEVHGLEDPDLYRANVAAYEQVDALKDAALQELETARLLESGLDLDEVSPINDQWTLLQRMLQLHLKPAEYSAYLDHKYVGLEGSALTDAIRAAESFYTFADERSRVFLKNLAAASGEGPKLLVVGGYHTAMMAEELRKQGISFAVLTPGVTQTGYDGLYARGMQNTISALKLR